MAGFKGGPRLAPERWLLAVSVKHLVVRQLLHVIVVFRGDDHHQSQIIEHCLMWLFFLLVRSLIRQFAILRQTIYKHRC